MEFKNAREFVTAMVTAETEEDRLKMLEENETLLDAPNAELQSKVQKQAEEITNLSTKYSNLQTKYIERFSGSPQNLDTGDEMTPQEQKLAQTSFTDIFEEMN